MGSLLNKVTSMLSVKKYTKEQDIEEVWELPTVTTLNKLSVKLQYTAKTTQTNIALWV